MNVKILKLEQHIITKFKKKTFETASNFALLSFTRNIAWFCSVTFETEMSNQKF